MCQDTDGLAREGRYADNGIVRRCSKSSRIVRHRRFATLFPSRNSALVTLMEEDSPDPEDRLGDHTIRKDELGQGWHRAHFRSDDTARYWLDYEVFQG